MLAEIFLRIQRTLAALFASENIHRVAQWTVLVRARRRLRGLWIALRRPPVGQVSFGDLRRVAPISRRFGYDRGWPIDRYYIENFLARQADDIRGHVLEIKDASYTSEYGGSRVEVSDVLDMAEHNPQATLVADLTCADHVPSDTFDCIILTQTLQFIYDVRAALHTLYRILKPGGVLLATFPGITQIARYDMERWGEYWRFTTLSSRKLFAEVFPENCITIQAYGNVLTAIAFLHGLLTSELRREDLDYHDHDYEVLITIRARKPQK
jgi:SAM-dependent methyltransferase